MVSVNWPSEGPQAARVNTKKYGYLLFTSSLRLVPAMHFVVYPEERGDMTDPTHDEKKSSARSLTDARVDQRETVLLSDASEPASHRNTQQAAAPIPGDPNLNSAALAALGQRYDILGEAGQGSMGNVYRARDRETGETVALKLVKSEFASDQAMMERFKNELLFARKITHKNVCRVYEFNRIAGVAYTSMEFVEGESLRSVLNRFGGLPLSKAVDVTLQICSGLKEAHAQGIVHRDLKPENVMIDSRGNVKIMDFGIARSMEAATRLTGAMVGTPAYMAPEQVGGKPVDYRTDIYSLGLMLYELFTGRAAFVADNPVAVALKHLRESPIPPHEIDPTIPVPIERTILKCLEKEAGNRFQSIAELERALSAFGTRAPLNSGTNSTLVPGNGEAKLVVNPVATGPSDVLRAKAKAKRASPFAWLILAASGVVAAGGMRWMTVSRTADQIPAPPRLPAPVAPVFALEKPAWKSVENKSAIREAVAEPEPPASNEIVPPLKSADVTPPRPAAPLQSSSGSGKAFGQIGNSWLGKGLGYVWIGRFQRQDRAQAAAKKIEDMGLPVVTVPRRNPSGEFFVVLSGPFPAKKVSDVMQQLQQHGFTNIHPIRNPVGDQNANP